jgi:S-adenosylmethionine:tRNA ribosyltransferase-isomerase
MTTTASTDEDPLAILDDYDFELPESSIAQTALSERDAARLLVLNRTNGSLVEPEADHRVRDLAEWLRPNDLIIVNATRVLSARLVGRKSTGGAAEVLLLAPEPLTESVHKIVPPEELDGPAYRALLKCTGRVRVGLELQLGRAPGLRARVDALYERGEVRLQFASGADPYSLGEAPLPPYIRRPSSPEPTEKHTEPTSSDEDLARYQTIFAREPGAIAAPTAGLHFTPELFARLRERGIARAEVILHVGAGTFRPLNRESLETGRLHSEEYELPPETVQAIQTARRAGGRIVAVGTTTVRVLESCVDAEGVITPGRGETQLFIRPGGRPFRVVNALLTNFHLPRSSLLLLVAAFVGRGPLLDAYRFAIENGFRFYSYGDAMLIAPDADLGRDGLGASRDAGSHSTDRTDRNS